MLAIEQTHPFHRRTIDQIASGGAHHRVIDRIACLSADRQHTMVHSGLQVIGDHHGQAGTGNIKSLILMAHQSIPTLNTDADSQQHRKNGTTEDNQRVKTILRGLLAGRRMQRKEPLDGTAGHQTDTGQETHDHHQHAGLGGTRHHAISID